MIVKNKKIADGEDRILMGKLSEIRSNITNLPLNLLVDDCSGVENDNKKDTKKNLKWNKPKAQSILLTKTNAVNNSFNLTLKMNDEFKGATMDPSINDLNKKYENLTLHERRIPENSQESEDTNKTKKINLKKIYTEEELKILSDLVNFLKKYKAELHTLNEEEEDSTTQAETHDKVLKARGPIKKNGEKNRQTPFDRSTKSSAPPSERIQLAATPSLTVTTNDGNRAHVYVQNDQSSMDVVTEQDYGLPKYIVDEVKKVLSSTALVEQFIAYFQSEFNESEGGELLCNTTNTESQVLNIQCDPQPNILIEQYHPQHSGTHISPESPLHKSFTPFSPQNSEKHIVSMVLVNSLGNAKISPLVPLNHQKPFMSYSPQHTDSNFESLAALSPIHRSPPPQSFKSHSPLHRSLITQPSLTQQPPQQTNITFTPQLNNKITKTKSSTSPHKLTMYTSQKSPASSQFFINPIQQHNESKVSPIPQRSPYTQMNISPTTSPCQAEPFDSSYETGSPSSSSAVTSPGSPYITSSISSESDQDFSPGEPRYTTSANDKTAFCIQKPILPYRPGMNKNKQNLRPLGEVIQPSTKSAEQTLGELSTTWNQQYIIQLVCVAISTNKYPNDCVRGFRENLMKTIHSQIDKKHENIWKLAIFVHLEFLKAPDRVKQYKDALLKKHEEPSLLYIAAVQRNCPLIARYIAEIMHQVGYNPAEVDANGNSILHVLAHLGDTHAEVLGELLAASDSKNGKKLFDAQATNKEGKSLLHIAVSSPKPQITTIVLLITYGSDTKRQDKFGKTALQYHLQAMVNRLEGSQRHPVDLQLAKKLLPPSTVESQKVLERLISDPSTPNIVLNLIEDLKREMR